MRNHFFYVANIPSTTTTRALLTFGTIAALFLAGCRKEERSAVHFHIGPDRLPTEGYDAAPEEPFDPLRLRGEKFEQMTEFLMTSRRGRYFRRRRRLRLRRAFIYPDWNPRRGRTAIAYAR